MRGEEKSWHSCGSERKEQRVEEEESGTGDKKGSLKRERAKRKR